MRLPLRIAILVTFGAFALGLFGCQQAPWKLADRSVAALAREVATHATNTDSEYFMSISPAPERVPELIEQIARSGIATNYAEHLRVETPTEATLVYGVMGDVTPGTSFAVRLSLVDGSARVDQIVAFHEGEVGWGLGTPSGSGVPSEESLSVPGVFSVSAAIASKRVFARSRQTAVIGYTNTSPERTSVSQPLSVTLRITGAKGGIVSTRESLEILRRASPVLLAPGETVYCTVGFDAPVPGDYILHASANGVQAPAVSFHTTEPK
jgi:hypothetical protein